MKALILFTLLLLPLMGFSQISPTEYKLDQYKQRNKNEKYTRIPMGDSAKIGQVYAFQSSEYWGWDYGILVGFDNNKYLLETYPTSGFKKIIKLKFKELHIPDNIQMNINQTVNLKITDHLDKAGTNLQIGTTFLTLMLANIAFYPQIFKIKSEDDLILFNVLNGGFALGTAISFGSAGMNLKLASTKP
jgi:hypothetical protein